MMVTIRICIVSASLLLFQSCGCRYYINSKGIFSNCKLDFMRISSLTVDSLSSGGRPLILHSRNDTTVLLLAICYPDSSSVILPDSIANKYGVTPYDCFTIESRKVNFYKKTPNYEWRFDSALSIAMDTLPIKLFTERWYEISGLKSCKECNPDTYKMFIYIKSDGRWVIKRIINGFRFVDFFEGFRNQ